MGLRDEQIERYSRQILLPGIGGIGQEKLLKSRVLLIGAGGLGSPSAYYLAAAGVGKIGIVDSDKVELSNLHRQILHFTTDLGKQKVGSAKEKICALNPDVEVVTYPLRLNSQNINRIIEDYDVVIDGSDNFPTRYLTNDACILVLKPLVYGAFFRFEGQAMTIIPRHGPCYRCLFPEPPPPGAVPSCQEAGVLGALAGIIGLIQASEVLKIILGIGELLVGKLLTFNALDMDFRRLNVPRDKSCPICGENPTINKLMDYEEFCGVRSSQARV
ncbi:MAG: molybdopterin-synthase adenylyltransferase MoeB [Actinobacteria bacterium]|nr:molybdopterin-synthase adenylyltransferase MoeB [Actinomycetota bacterium]